MSEKATAARITATPQRADSQRASAAPSSASTVATAIGRLQGRAGNRVMRRLALRIQPKLTVNRPDDEYEQEADRVADEVMRMPERGTPASIGSAPPRIQRVCPDCEEDMHRTADLVTRRPQASISRMCHAGEREHHDHVGDGGAIQRQEQTGEEEEAEAEELRLLQMRSGSDEPRKVSSSLDSYLASTATGGQPLPENTGVSFEQRFGRDFSAVRVHTDDRAAEAVKDVNAVAFATGSHIHFAHGRFQPGTPQGDRLLAHELTHVIQQGCAGERRCSEERGSPPQATRTRAVVARQQEPPAREAGPVVSRSKASLGGGREITIERELDLYTGLIERRPGSVASLTYTRRVWIKTPEGHESSLEVRASIHLYPPFKPAAGAEAALRHTGELLNLRSLVRVKYADPLLSFWHVPPNGNQWAQGNLQSLLNLARQKGAPVAQFGLSKKQQYAALAAFVEQSAAVEIPEAARLKEERRKRPHPRPTEEPDRAGRDSDAEKRESVVEPTEPGGDRQGSTKSTIETVAVTIADLATDFTPGVSNVKDAITALTGVNPVTREKVGWLGRVLAAIFAIPGVGNLLKYVGKGFKIAGAALFRLGRKIGAPLIAAGAWGLGKAKKLWNWALERLGRRRRPSLAPRSARLQEVLDDIADEMPDLVNIVDEHALDTVVTRLGEDALDHILLAATAREGGARAAQIAKEYIDMASEMVHIRNLESLFKDMGEATAVKAARGSDFELRWVYQHRQSVESVAVARMTASGEKKGADVVLSSGQVTELKNFNLASNYYSEAADVAARKLTAQVERRLEEGFPSVRIVFSSDAGAIPQALQSALNTRLDELAQGMGINRALLDFGLWP